MADTDQRPGRRAGTLMLAAWFVLGLGLLTLFFNSLLERENNPNQQPVTSTGADGVREVRLQSNRQGHYVVTGYVNGQDARFLLDTGATDVVVSEELAGSAGLERGYAGRATTAAGVITVYSTVIDELRIGDIVLHGVRASINPAMVGETILLGMSALRQVEFSQRGNSLTLRQYPGT